MTGKNRFLLPLLVLASALVLGACTHENIIDENTAGSDNSASEAEMDALSRAIALGQSVRCTDANPESASEINEYLAKDGRMKINSTDTETQTAMHFLIMDNSSYYWAEGEDTGYMFSVDPENAADAVESVENLKQQLPDVEFSPNPDTETEEKVEFDCEETDIADSEFELPENVNFVNPSEMFQESINNAQQEFQEQAGELTEEQQQQLDQFLQQMEN